MSSQHALFSKPPSAGAKELRDYQDDAVIAIFDYFDEHPEGSPLVIVPTAGGKSLIIADFIRRANTYYPGTRHIVVSHASILLEQNAEELANQYPEADFSFYSDKIGQKDLSGETIFASIQSIYKKAYELQYAPDIIHIDEAHLISDEDGSMYRQFFADMLIINPQVRFVGYTATPYRPGKGMLHKGKNALFTHIAYEIPILELIKRGHLCPLVTPDEGIKTKMDTTGVSTRAGDYVNSSLAKAVDKEEITRACVEETLYHFHEQGRKKAMVFTVNIEHCIHVYEEFKRRGVNVEMVHSKMKTGVNQAIDRFKNGDAQFLINVAMLTTGANFPQVDLLANMRPMRSPVLYVQVGGRGMRIYPGKVDCLFLDFGGVIDELGPIDQIHVKEKGEGTGEAPMKICDGCGQLCHAGCATCPHCGLEFPENSLNLDTKASQSAALSSQMKAKIVKVSKVAYFRNPKEGKPDSLRVDYLCGFETYREWACFEHSNAPREIACNWWRQRSASTPPNTITEALQRTGELRAPLYIHVKKMGKYHEIVGVDFNEMEEENEY